MKTKSFAFIFIVSHDYGSAEVTEKLGKSIYISLNKSRSRIFISILFKIDFETNISDKIFIEEKRFEAII